MITESIIASALGQVGLYLLRKIKWAEVYARLRTFYPELIAQIKTEPRSYKSIGQMKRDIIRRRSSKMERVNVRGTVAPNLLLSAGWWEGRDSLLKPSLISDDPLKQWLFRGFEEWGPSWNINNDNLAKGGELMVAQIGEGDEAESLGILLTGDMATRSWEWLYKKWAFDAEIVGTICSREQAQTITGGQLDEHMLEKLPASFNQCLLISDRDKKHKIVETRKDPAPYSGYLWQCLVPTKVVKRKQEISLRDAIFVWEHTDFTRPDAVQFNLECLLHKVEILKNRYGNLTLLQKSSPDIPGKTRLTVTSFMDVLAGKTLNVL